MTASSSAKLAIVARQNEGVPPASPGPVASAPGSDYLETTASLAEMAEALGISMSAVYARAARGHWVTHDEFPSQKLAGATETRVIIQHLPKEDLRRLRRFRRR